MPTNSDVQELIFFNGINGETGGYSLPPSSADEMAKAFEKERAEETVPENINELRFRHKSDTVKHLGVKANVDPKKLGEAGWGVIFSQDADPEIKKALQKLIDLRQDQSGKYFRCYEGADGYQPGESKSDFLARHGAGPGPADPDNVPYYLLIVGSPAEIPYRFQSQLDVAYAVGRIHFNTLQEYANYAQSVVDADPQNGKVKLARQASFFGAANGFTDAKEDPRAVPGDPATKLSADALVRPLYQSFKENHKDWDIRAHLYGDATKAQLGRLLGGDQTPALLFSATHGMDYTVTSPNGFAQNNPQKAAWQMARQGALITQDWPGPKKWKKGPIPGELYFAGVDLDDDSNLLGMISFFFACFGAGTPLLDEYAKKYQRSTRKQISPFPFIAHLPQRMLAHPQGGALAVIGHVERGWPYSFAWPGAGKQIEVFKSTLEKLFDGYPVGHAVEYFNERYAELASELSDELQDIQFGKKINDPGDLIGKWTANNDARGYTVIGDPAVRLPVAEAPAAGEPRQVIAPVTISGKPRESEPNLPEISTDMDGQQSESEQQISEEDFVRPFTPLPNVSEDFIKRNPELYKAWVEHIEQGYKNSDEVFGKILSAFLRSHHSTLIMYWILFLIGVAFFGLAGYLALVQGEVIGGAVFGGLGVVSFITYFFSRPTQSVEENLMFITWLGILYNSYWTQLAWSFNEETAQAELSKATEEAIEQLNALIDKHGASSSRRPNVGS